MPRWAVSRVARISRTVFRAAIVQPLFKHYIELSVDGLERVDSCGTPVLLAANHLSHLDTVAVLCALPGRQRSLLAPAMMKEYFAPHFQPEDHGVRQRWASSIQYVLACGLFNAFPLAQRLVGTRDALRYTGELVEKGFCPLIFPEGRRSPDGRLQAFQRGIGLMATRLGTPVIPVRIEGSFEVMSLHDRWADSSCVVLADVTSTGELENPDHPPGQHVVLSVREVLKAQKKGSRSHSCLHCLWISRPLPL